MYSYGNEDIIFLVNHFSIFVGQPLVTTIRPTHNRREGPIIGSIEIH